MLNLFGDLSEEEEDEVDSEHESNPQPSFVDGAIWAAENATLKAEMSGKKLMHSWNNLSSTLSFRRFRRGFGILQLGVHESLLAVKLD
ncbi:uncharacterized protein LOC125468295 isoform X8 [Pyrus x bretschneideri]|uniref:uncharacterized protein LOC125468295 isoform X8 n=1 Tax=Pyrus x bretschneideri TaxID=225117 RepID=UPI00202EE2BE|nr:uncharacterized protein LOC125468295 isoform X8 [Pyrus x bretschneideri]